ncbi:MAG: N-acetylmuramoyl-L-alanine amidase, partial [Taibaiella sp.]|nr:N-acetylmuramoyl-L-alanine amidase [Taibaiella sp.]
IVHYTATDTAQSAIDWFMNTAANPDHIAAHVVIDTDGTITQLIPFTLRANHAGTSTWDGVSSMNEHAIGIELVNPGYLEKLPDGSYRRQVTATKTKLYPATESTRIIAADHKHKFWKAKDNHHWFIYPDAQMQALYALARALFSAYQLVTAIGHDDISPARKPDPGPAFNWHAFRQNVFGKTDNTGFIYKTNTPGTKLRVSATTTSAEIKSLPVGYEVGLIGTRGQWSKVYLVNEKKEVIDNTTGTSRSIKTIGWIHNSLLTIK